MINMKHGSTNENLGLFHRYPEYSDSTNLICRKIDSSKYFSNENIMQDIPILEIDCNMEFHDNQEIKDKMLDQV